MPCGKKLAPHGLWPRARGERVLHCNGREERNRLPDNVPAKPTQRLILAVHHPYAPRAMGHCPLWWG